MPTSLCQMYLNQLNRESENVYALAVVNSSQYCSKRRTVVQRDYCKF